MLQIESIKSRRIWKEKSLRALFPAVQNAAVQPGTDEKYEKEIAGYSAGYKAKVREATGYLGEAKLAYHQYQRSVLESVNPDRRIGSMDWIIGKLFGR